jgi:transposase
MANVLKMADQAAIIGLWQRGWSQRRIARVTGIDRETVGRYVGLARAGWHPGEPVPGNPNKPRTSSNPAISTPGSGVRDGPGGSDEPDSNLANSSDIRHPRRGVQSRDSLAMSFQKERIEQCPVAPATGSGRRSLCEPYREAIEAKLKQGLSAQRIWQDLDGDGFEGGYQSVKRFCRRLKSANPLPFRRMECEPGAEAQVDFGTGAPVITSDGKRRRTHVFRIVLSHSRKAYSESVYRQTTDEFIRCIENAFRRRW